MRLLKIESSTTGAARDTPAGALRNCYLMLPEERELIPRIFPFALVFDYTPVPKVKNAPFKDSTVTTALKNLGVLNALAATPHVSHLYPWHRHPTLVDTPPDELKTFFEGGFSESPRFLVVVPARVSAIEKKKNSMSFVHPWAFSWEKLAKSKNRKRGLRSQFKDFLSQTEPQLVWAGRDRGHLCASCDKAMLAVMNKCKFPTCDCPVWRQNVRAELSLST